MNGELTSLPKLHVAATTCGANGGNSDGPTGIKVISQTCTK